MSVRILKRAYSNLFAPQTEDKPDWLIGNVGDWLRLKLEVEAGVDYLATQSQPMSINQDERTLKLMNGKKWTDYGLDIGSNPTLTFKVDTNGTVQTYLIEFVIEQMFNDTLVYAENENMEDVPFEMIPTDRGTIRVYNVKIYDDREIQGVKIKYANIDNSQVESHTLNSFIDGTETELMYVGLDLLPINSGFQNMTKLGLQSGMSINEARIKKLGQGQQEIYEEFNSVGNQSVHLAVVMPNININYRIVREAWALPFLISNNQPDFQSINGIYKLPIHNTEPIFGEYNFGQPQMCFLLNASEDSVKRFNLNFQFQILDTNLWDSFSSVGLVLIKYNQGNLLVPNNRTVLKGWGIGEFPTGVTLDYNDSFVVDITEGDSYALALEWNHQAINPTSRYILPQIINLSCTVENLGTNIETYKKKYEIEVDFMLSSFFEQISDLDGGTPPQVVFNANSLTDAIKLTFLPEWNNPNIKIENDMKETERLGNTGWFNENYNGLQNNFEVKSVQYFDAGGQTTTGLSYGEETKVRAVIGGISNLAVDSDFKHGFIWLPIEEEQYKDKTTPFHKNTKISSHFSTTAFNANMIYPFTYEGYSEDNAKMNTRAISYTIQGEDLVFEAVFSPTPEFLTYFEDKIQDRKYAIWVSVADKNLQTNYSDRVSLLLDVNNMDLFIPTQGELEKVTTTFLEHPQSHLDAGVENYEGFLEDDILARSFFSIDNGKRLGQIVLGYEVENMETGASFELERFSANLQNFITTPEGVQEIDFNSERGYLLEPNFNKNWVKIVRNESGDTETTAGYQILFAQKIRWEYWLQKANVPVEFYDNTLEFNGSNTDWLHFLREGINYNINFFILFDFIENGEIIRYKNKYEIRFNGYDENENITTGHKYYDDETNLLLDAGTEQGKPLGILLSNKNTRVEITYKKEDGNWDIGDVYAVTTLEINKGAGVMAHRQLSSIIGSENDNILIPLESQTKLKVEQISPSVIKTSCLVDFTKLTAGVMYKVTGRIGCFPNNNGIPISTRRYDEENYESNYE